MSRAVSSERASPLLPQVPHLTAPYRYKDGEQKRLSDPMALMNSFLKRREDVLSGAPIRRAPPSTGRERYPAATPLSDRDDLSPVITSLLAPRRRRGDPIPAAPPPKPSPTPYRSSSTTKDPASEAASRVSNERARAAALIASKGAVSASSVASETPRSDAGMGGFGMFNRDETREAKERRGGWGRGGWEEQKRRRDDRERGGRARPY